MRKMTTIRRIDTIEPIKNADFIELAKVGGWNIIVKKGLFAPGDKAVFFEIDSLLNQEHPEFADLAKRGVKTVHRDGRPDMTGHVLKTMKMRGVFSQGMLAPLDAFGLTGDETQEAVDARFEDIVVKYEAPLPVGSANIIGHFPGFIRKTDSERVQNLDNDFLATLNPDDWFATEKIDGTSTTFWKDENGAIHAASRNFEIAVDDTISKIVDKHNIDTILAPGEFVQGEMFGAGINGNHLKRNGVEFRAFAATDPKKFEDIWVPTLELELPSTVDEALEQVDKMRSTINNDVLAEGIVWHNKKGETFPETGDRPNFKAINNSFLAKYDNRA